MKTVRALVLTLLIGLIGAVAAGCGSSSGAGSGSNDPAAVVPAGAPVYAEATVRPSGSQRAHVEAVLRKVLRTNDPGAKLRNLFDESGRKDGLAFAADIEPWLGDRVAVAVTSLHNTKADALVIAASTDDAKARAALEKAKGDFVDRTYRGVTYRFDRTDATAAGVVDHRVAAGSEGAFKAAVDASKGDSLADANALRAARAKVAQDRVGFLYVDVQGLVRAVGQAAASDPQVGAALQSFAGALPKTLAAALQVDPDAIRVDAVSIGTPQHGAGGSAADVVAALPSDSWLALGVANLGQAIDRALQNVAGAGGLSGVGIQALLGQVQQQTGLDLRKDVLAWMGDAGLFVTGTSPSTVGGALVVKTSDPAGTRRAIAALERLARQQGGGTRVAALNAQGVDGGFVVRSSGSPTVWVALARDRFVVAIGARSALAQAIAPTQPLSSSPAFTAAAAKLGGGLRPAFFVDLQPVTALIGAASGGDAQYAKAKPYLDAFGALAAGGKDEGNGVSRARLVVTLR